MQLKLSDKVLCYFTVKLMYQISQTNRFIMDIPDYLFFIIVFIIILLRIGSVLKHQEKMMLEIKYLKNLHRKP